ncbi:MAG: hypothetical protein HY273_04080, partial [Gammaproteobacteria bacterium]|nr:hypothetical protein [Gammaproteobacteria bacterium]
GDGKTDLIHIVGGNYVHTWNSDGAFPDLLTKVTTGFDAQTTITYKPLTDTAVYTKANNAAYPTKDVQDHTNVVSEYSVTNGVSAAYVASKPGTLSTSKTKYHYTDKKEHERGRGDLGFRIVEVTAPNGVVSTTYNLQDFPFTGSPYQTDVKQPNGKLLSKTLNAYDQTVIGTTATAGYFGNKRYLTYSTSTTSYSYELDETEISHVTTTSDPPDVDGNTKKVKVESSDGFIKTTESVFYPSDYTNWQFGQVATTSMTSTMPGAFSVTGQALTGTRKAAFVYDAAGRLKTEIVEPNTFDVGSKTFTWGNSTVVTAHSYDAWGIKTESTVTGLDYVIGPDLDAAGKVKLDPLTQKPLERIISGSDTQVSRRTSKSSYVENGDGTATVTSWNAKDHKETQTIDLRFGVPISSTGPNGLTTQWYYDAFGRKVRELRADGTYSDTEYLDCSVCPSHVATPKYRVKSSSSTSTAVAYAYYDVLGRVITTESQGLNNETIYKDAYYDDYGRVWKSTNAYYANNPVGKTESITTYNAILGRVESGSMPDESQPDSSATVSTSTAYSVYSYFDSTSGSTVIVPRVVITDSNSHSRVEEHNTEGKLVETTDALGSTVKYRYDAFGNLVVVENQGYDGVKLPSIVTGYDSRGRKIYMQDPDMGQWQYGYNTFGELKWQQDAKGQVVTMDYDVLGRMVKRSEPEGASTWTYDTAPHGIGKVAQEVGFKGQAVGGSSSFTYPPARSYVYDSLGRPALVGIALNGEMYTMYSAYDASGRLESTTYPGVNGERFSVKRNFNSLGYVTNITDGAGLSTFWRVDSMDASGRVTKETLGNGATNEYTYTKGGRVRHIKSLGGAQTIQDFSYEYDKVANLHTRDDGSSKEVLGYDALDRLTSVTATGNAAFNKTYSYDSFGNFKTKSDVDADEWVYGLKPGVASPFAGPHAVTQLKKAGAVVGQYAYDANGNQTSGTGRNVDYTSFNMPKRIATAASVVEFAYDAQHERIIQVKDGDMTLYMSPRWDAGTQFLKETKKDGTVEYQHHIYAASSPVAVYTVTVKNSVVTKKTRYFHKDNLGSVTAISGDVNGVFQVFERFSFEPFGARRQSGLFTNLTSIETKHGYTGHEMLDSVNLIHMNGRIYDTKIGRFLQADPSIQAPNNLQSYNRYSYVMNNPLSMSDPSGYSWLSKKWKKAWNHGLKQVTAIVVAAAIIYACPTCQVLAGSVAGYINTGTLKGAVMGGVSAYAFNVAGNIGPSFGAGPGGALARMALHGAVGGAMSVAQGGSFKSGFISGAFSKATSGLLEGEGMNYAQHVGINALVGGIGSRLGGGSFRDGAMTGAFSYMFNDYIHEDGHEYDYRTRICSVGSAGCTPENVYEGLLRHDYPGQPSGTVVVNNGEYYVFGEYTGNSNLGHINVYVDRDSLVTYNETASGHIFYGGSVTQAVVVDQGSIYIKVYGTGSNSGLFNATTNYVAGYVGFTGNHEAIRQYVLWNGVAQKF